MGVGQVLSSKTKWWYNAVWHRLWRNTGLAAISMKLWMSRERASIFTLAMLRPTSLVNIREALGLTGHHVNVPLLEVNAATLELGLTQCIGFDTEGRLCLSIIILGKEKLKYKIKWPTLQL